MRHLLVPVAIAGALSLEAATGPHGSPQVQPQIHGPELRPRYVMEEMDAAKFKADAIAGAKEWRRTRKPRLECTNQLSEAASKLPCTARIAFDGKRVLFFITIGVDPAKPLKLAGEWGSRDGLELAFCGVDKDAPVFLLHGFPDGTYEVSCATAAPSGVVTALKKAVAYAAKAGEDAWTAELSVPLDAAGIAPQTFRQLRFNMNVRRTCDDTWTCWWTPENGIADLLSSGLLILPRKLPETDEMVRRGKAVQPLFGAERKGDLRWQLIKDWGQTADPDCLGPAKQPGDAPRVSFKGYAGWAVARKAVEVTAEQLAAPFCVLFLPCIDEEGHVHINGKLALSHTAEATGSAPGVLWREPVMVDLKPLVAKPGKADVAVHIRGNMGTGGLRKGAFLVWGKPQPTAEQLYDLLAASHKLGWRDRVPAFWQDFERVRIPPLPSVPDEAGFGKRIQRTMNLLASSTAAKRNRVRIFFYGQSITAGMHSREMINVLRNRYPWAIIDFENRAIGGFGASTLLRTGEHDLYPRDADLLVFHVYGDAKSLDKLFGNVRRRNSSEILVYTHHYNWVSSPQGLQKKLAYLAKSTAEWHELAEKYRMELAPVNRDWPLFFLKHDWGINEVMGDTVHSNVHHNVTGHVLLAKLVLRNFRHHPGAPLTFPNLATAIPLHSPAVTVNGRWQKDGSGLRTREKGAGIKIAFDGNRVDVLPLPCANPGTAKILIDGKAPEQFRELYYCNRPSNAPYTGWPAIKRIDLGPDVLPRAETWTLTPSDVDLAKRTFSFRLEGSVTGPDGAGDTSGRFVSNSGRIIFSPRESMIARACQYRKKDKLPDDYKVTWETLPLFQNPWRPPANVDPVIERPVTLVKGLPNGRHTLEIIANGDGEIPVKALIVRQPPLK